MDFSSIPESIFRDSLQGKLNTGKWSIMKKSPNLVILGAGSYFFGREAIYNAVNSPILRSGTLNLVDTDEKVLDTMLRLARRAKEHAGAPLEINGSTDRRTVLKNADFVVLTFSFRNAYYRQMDTMISKKYGVTMCSGDTIGPGGIFRSLRELPEILRIARDVRELAPDAWVINLVNPTAVHGLGLMRHAPDLHSFALCDDLHDPYKRAAYLFRCGITPKIEIPIDPEQDEKFDLQILGVNHCNFVVKCTYDGQDRMENLRQWAAREAEQEYLRPPMRHDSKQHYNHQFALQLFDLYGAYPNALGHIKEYVPFFQGYGVSPITPEPIVPFDGFRRDGEMRTAWRETEQMADGTIPIETFFRKGKGDHATDIIESMWGGLGKRFYINTPNRGAVPNMPEDAFLELRCDLDRNGPRPIPSVPLPHGVLGLTQQVLDTHELTVEAAVSCDRRILLRALASDPIVNNLGDAKNIMNELLELERDHLPPEWFR